MKEAVRLKLDRLGRATVACSFALLAGCFRVPAFNPSGAVQDHGTSQLLCEQAMGRGAGDQTFRALLEATLKTSDEEAYSFRYAIVGRPPTDMRVDILPREGAFTLGLMTVHAGHAVMLDTQTKTYRIGCDPSRLFERFFGLQGVSLELVRALIQGRVVGLECRAAQVYRTQEGRIVIVDTARHYAWEIDESTHALVAVDLLDESLAKVYVHAERQYSPDVIHMSVFKPISASAEMIIKKLAYNPTFSVDPFVVTVPSEYDDAGC